MNDLVTDVKSLELETLKNLKSSKALNTLRAYKADFRDFALLVEFHINTTNKNTRCQFYFGIVTRLRHARGIHF